MVEEGRTAADEQRASARVHYGRESGADFAFIGGLRDHDLAPNSTTRLHGVSRLYIEFSSVGVQQHADDGSLGNQFVQQPQSFGCQIEVKDDAGMLPPGRLRLATRPVRIGSLPPTKTIGVVSSP